MNFLFNSIKHSLVEKKTIFIKQILSKNYNMLSQVSEELKSVSESYMAISHILTRNESKLEGFLKSSETKLDLTLLLIQQNLCLEYVFDYLKKTKCRDYLYYLCIKELFIRDLIDFDANLLIEKIDDFDIYKYCIEQNILIHKKDTINFLYYKLHLNELTNLGDLLIHIKSYKDFEYILSLTSVTEDYDDHTNAMIKHFQGGFDAGFSKQLSDRVKQNNKDDKIVKLLLAQLISSKKVNNLVLALFIAKSYAFGFVENYDIDLIYIFLLKYFLFYDEVVKVYKQMDIKNNQSLNMSYIWSDAYINVSKKYKDVSQDMKLKHLEYINNLKTTLLKNIFLFIESDKISYALNLIDLLRKVNINDVALELQKNNFLEHKDKKNMKTQFSCFLGSKCEYLFNKNCCVYNLDIKGNVFENEISEIDDMDFKIWFTGLTKKYY